MSSHPIPVQSKDIKPALEYFLGKRTRVELNRAYKMREEAPSGLHRAARVMRQLAAQNPNLYRAIESLTS